MSRFDSRTLVLIALRLAPLMLFAILCVAFGLASDRFLSLANFRNILTQSTHVAVMAIGMTFVLLVRGVDLSVGSVMYLFRHPREVEFKRAPRADSPMPPYQRFMSRKSPLQ